MHHKKSLCHQKEGISDIIGIMLLLGSAVVIFSVVYFSLLSTPIPVQSPNINLVSSLQGENDQYNITVQHWGGEPVDVNARFFFEIAGIRQPEEILKDHILDNSKDEAVWNFGEQISFPVGDIKGLQVEMGIADTHSNSLVLLSTLQEGYVVPPFGRGGIWHFNEDDGDTVYDSSGNNNHGTKYGAIRVTGINGTNGLEFDGLDDYVYVPFGPGLDIRGNISIEAWVNAKTINEPINQTEFDVKTGYFPNITYVNGDIYAVVYRLGSNKNKDITMKTLEIQSDGWIVDSSIQNMTVDNGGYEPVIIKISSTCCAVIYGDSNEKGVIKTYFIDDLGGITLANSENFSLDHCEVVSISKITENVYAIVYGSDQQDSLNPGSMQTVHISDGGDITLLHNYNNFNEECGNPDIIKITENLYLIAYIDGSENDELVLETFDINETYHITGTTNSVSYSKSCDDPTLFKISNNVMGVAFTNDTNEGVLRTYEVSDAGVISYSGNHFVFDEFKCSDVDVLKLYQDAYGIVYESGPSHRGRIVKMNILSNGSIKKMISIKDYDSNNGYEPDIFKISEHIFGVVYREDTNPHPGGLATFSLFNDYDYSSQNAGVYKKDSYTLFANGTAVVGGINDKSLSFSLGSGWQHIAITYNQSKITLYINGSEKISASYSEPLNVNNNPIYIGDFFFGKMDEVAIFDHVLTGEEILNHYLNPGSLG